jgi:hypothetical protein
MMGSPEMHSNMDIYLKQRLAVAEEANKIYEKLLRELILGLIHIEKLTNNADWRNKKAMLANSIAAGKVAVAKSQLKDMFK